MKQGAVRSLSKAFSGAAARMRSYLGASRAGTSAGKYGFITRGEIGAVNATADEGSRQRPGTIAEGIFAT